MKFPFYKQAESKDCEPICIKIIIKHYGKIISAKQVRKLSKTTREGSSLLGLSDAVEKIGFYSVSIKTSYKKEIPFRYEMRGSAEIITEDLRLIERFFIKKKYV